ncbi:MAG: hypothetical protein ACPLXC_00035 [Candidatus Pacearchaeota archaeon]
MDLRLSEFAIVYSGKASKYINSVKPKFNNNLKVFRGDSLRKVIQEYRES